VEPAQDARHLVEERAAARAHHDLVARTEGALGVERPHERRHLVQVPTHTLERLGRAVVGHRALVALHPGQLEQGRCPHGPRHLHRRLDASRPRPRSRRAQFDQHGDGALGPGAREPLVHVQRSRGSVHQAQEVEARIGLELARQPLQPGGLDQLVGHEHPRHAEGPHDPHLADRRRRDPPRARLELAGEELRGHGRLAVRGEQEAALGAPALHEAEVVLERVLLEHHHRQEEVPLEHVPAPLAEFAQCHPAGRRHALELGPDGLLQKEVDLPPKRAGDFHGAASTGAGGGAGRSSGRVRASAAGVAAAASRRSR
jgi:hypothetical protein